jgi:hypothetical protein
VNVAIWCAGSKLAPPFVERAIASPCASIADGVLRVPHVT